jgi:hypothetical protein
MLDADAIFQKIQVAGEDWADKKAAFTALEDMTSTVRADLTTDFYVTCTSKAEASERALASTRYKEHIASVAGARRAWLMAEVKYKNLQLLAELRRSEESTRRAEMGVR